MSTKKIKELGIINLPKIYDSRGNLTYIESGRQLPFEIKRVYYLYDVPGGATRAGHARGVLKKLLVIISASFDIKHHWRSVCLKK